MTHRPLSAFTMDELTHALGTAEGLAVRAGAMTARLHCTVPEAVAGFHFLYADFLATADAMPVDFHLAIKPSNWWRRFYRRTAIAITDIENPVNPMPAEQAVLVSEMALNWQSAWASNRYLAMHGAVVGHKGRAIVITANSGGGKSTLSAGLSIMGWQFLTDELTLLRLDDGLLQPNPRPASLKNQSIDVLGAMGGSPRMLKPLEGTFKGRLTFMRATPADIEVLDRPLPPAAIILPQFVPDAGLKVEPAGRNEAFYVLAQGAANYELLGAAGFDALARLVTSVPTYRVTYGRIEEVEPVLKWIAEGGQP